MARGAGKRLRSRGIVASESHISQSDGKDKRDTQEQAGTDRPHAPKAPPARRLEPHMARRGSTPTAEYPLVGPVGLEPTTYGLKVRCSAY